MPKEISSEDARQGRRGIRLLIMLIGGLVFAACVWAVADIYVFQASKSHTPAGTGPQRQLSSPPAASAPQNGKTSQ